MNPITGGEWKAHTLPEPPERRSLATAAGSAGTAADWRHCRYGFRRFGGPQPRHCRPGLTSIPLLPQSRHFAPTQTLTPTQSHARPCPGQPLPGNLPLSAASLASIALPMLGCCVTTNRSWLGWTSQELLLHWAALVSVPVTRPWPWLGPLFQAGIRQVRKGPVPATAAGRGQVDGSQRPLGEVVAVAGAGEVGPLSSTSTIPGPLQEAETIYDGSRGVHGYCAVLVPASTAAPDSLASMYVSVSAPTAAANQSSPDRLGLPAGQMIIAGVAMGADSRGL